MDATQVTAHSEEQLAAATFKRGFGFHPIGAWADHGQDGTGEPLAMLLRPGNAGSVRHEVAHGELITRIGGRLMSTA